MWFGNKLMLATHISWLINGHGKVPRGKELLHKCDNPPCVNDRHLFVGTQKENVRDCISKDRKVSAYGERHGLHKLTLLQVESIRIANSKGSSCYRLGKFYNVSPSTIWRIINGQTWK